MAADKQTTDVNQNCIDGPYLDINAFVLCIDFVSVSFFRWINQIKYKYILHWMMI